MDNNDLQQQILDALTQQTKLLQRIALATERGVAVQFAGLPPAARKAIQERAGAAKKAAAEKKAKG